MSAVKLLFTWKKLFIKVSYPLFHGRVNYLTEKLRREDSGKRFFKIWKMLFKNWFESGEQQFLIYFPSKQQNHLKVWIIKAKKRRGSDDFIVNFEHMSHLFLVFLSKCLLRYSLRVPRGVNLSGFYCSTSQSN